MAWQETKIRLAKAVLLRDAFTGEPVSSGIRMHLPFGGKMEKKGGGYFLFLDINLPEFEVEMESPIYQFQTITLKSDGGADVEEVLLHPSPAYPRQAACTAVRGRAETPGSVLRFHMEQEAEGCRLLEDYNKGEQKISFYLKGRLQNTLWYIRRKQEALGAYLALKDITRDTGVYPLKKPLAESYAIKDTLIYPAWESAADEKGEFYLLLPKIAQEKCLLYYSYQDQGEEIVRTAEIFQGRENDISKED